MVNKSSTSITMNDQPVDLTPYQKNVHLNRASKITSALVTGGMAGVATVATVGAIVAIPEVLTVSLIAGGLWAGKEMVGAAYRCYHDEQKDDYALVKLEAKMDAVAANATTVSRDEFSQLICESKADLVATLIEESTAAIRANPSLTTAGVDELINTILDDVDVEKSHHTDVVMYNAILQQLCLENPDRQTYYTAILKDLYKVVHGKNLTFTLADSRQPLESEQTLASDASLLDELNSITKSAAQMKSSAKLMAEEIRLVRSPTVALGGVMAAKGTEYLLDKIAASSNQSVETARQVLRDKLVVIEHIDAARKCLPVAAVVDANDEAMSLRKETVSDHAVVNALCQLGTFSQPQPRQVPGANQEVDLVSGTCAPAA